MDDTTWVRSFLGATPSPAVSTGRPGSLPDGADRPARQTFAEALAELVDEAGAKPLGPGRDAQAAGGASGPAVSGPRVVPPSVAREVIPGSSAPAVLPHGPGGLAGGGPGELLAEILDRGSRPPTEPPAPATPPIGVLWPPKALRGTGTEGPGIGGTDAQVAETLRIKVDYYNNPTQYGITLNTEARLFLDAVSRGYVPNSPEGLGTLLAYLGMGSFTSDTQIGRPPEMTAYFKQFFAAEAGRVG